MYYYICTFLTEFFILDKVNIFLHTYIRIFFTGLVLSDKVRYCERFLELVIDLEALLPTRRYFTTVMDDNHLVVRCQLSNLLHRPEGSLFGQVSHHTKCE